MAKSNVANGATLFSSLAIETLLIHMLMSNVIDKAMHL
ncbi:hypothetical protein KUC_0384 [Vreelandella boliviensis LC1]|uniref:Uncharacterized protein n=1 Tax=Vreelandella boliviensis LC1 TaxID=1072583 RepID=A0A7U9GFX0_9GAMM|nr:hypothetical protein KUC_0384 [Halomonas boliviensis LC1]